MSDSPVVVVCTCASTKAGASQASSSSTVESALIASAAPSLPTQAMVAPSTSSAVANGSAGECTRPRR